MRNPSIPSRPQPALLPANKAVASGTFLIRHIQTLAAAGKQHLNPGGGWDRNPPQSVHAPFTFPDR